MILEVNGLKHPLEPPGIVIGRGTDADLRVNDPGVSRRHAELRIYPGDTGAPQVSVVDLGSTNGVLVNGHKVTQATLEDGATVRIGTTTMRIRYTASRRADHRAAARRDLVAGDRGRLECLS